MVIKKAFRKIFYLAILLLIALIALYLFLHSPYFNIEKIYTTGLKQLTEEEVLSYSGVTIGQNLFEVDNNLTVRTIEVHPMVKSVELVKHLPRTLEIKVLEREIWAIVPLGNEFLCIDNEGVVIDRRINIELIDYPLITISNLPERVNIGQVIQPQGIQLVNQVWKALNNSARESISDFHLNDKQELIIYTSGGTEIRFGNEERLEEKANFIHDILKLETEFNKNGTEVLEYIDLRFKGQPVVKTKV
ncbi:MAG: FtsQ-type POTRA domain-containing protein [Syntrophomonadaceae bacterium]|nr:FtsQ-type POTRA domain-containing protein [Syntrophomonadaceae bacterium]